MRITRIATAVVATLCGLLMATPASARPHYPPGPPRLTVRPAVVEVGGEVTVSGRNFGPHDQVTITVRYTGGRGESQNPAAAVPDVSAEGTAELGPGGKGFSKTVTADGQGRFTTRLTLRKVGVALIKAVGRPSGIHATARVRVLCEDDGYGRPRGGGSDRCDGGGGRPGDAAGLGNVPGGAPGVSSADGGAAAVTGSGAQIEPAAATTSWRDTFTWEGFATATPALTAVMALGAVFDW
jgi:hypothetical protein